ncbi:MAG TPA: SDR family oxidoreductase [Thermoleophilia bacterium]|nr:SDR family oxidoreductase [Thermoleophilia bacterium]
MDLAFQGKTALVTGAGSQVGFGREIALLLAAEGIDAVAVTDIDYDGAEETAQAVRSAGSRSLALHADITDNAAVKAMVGKVVEENGRIDILCNVAGAILHRDGVPIDLQDPVVWEKQFKLNLIGTMNVSQAVVPIMRAVKYGVIVNIGSGSTHQYAMGVGTYAMSKYALDLFTRQLAYVEAKAGIRVNCVAPGPAATNFGGILSDGQPELSPDEAEKQRAALLGHFPLGRIATARDVANATVFLASDVTSYVTGQVFHVSGGSVM